MKLSINSRYKYPLSKANWLSPSKIPEVAPLIPFRNCTATKATLPKAYYTLSLQNFEFVSTHLRGLDRKPHLSSPALLYSCLYPGDFYDSRGTNLLHRPRLPFTVTTCWWVSSSICLFKPRIFASPRTFMDLLWEWWSCKIHLGNVKSSRRTSSMLFALKKELRSLGLL